ncbi:MAG: asparagine synthase (glutamine-hydrolyzing) [Acidimicrobiia bacterium]
MCGIVAAFSATGPVPDLAPGSRTLHHRGPDAAGTFRSPGGRAALAHRRLSIIDLSDAGRQPLADNSGRFWLVFNGEIYNYRELRRELAGYPFRTETDSEVLLAAFIRWGPACLDRLIGMFAFVVWDEAEQRAFAARDRFGVKPLYLATARDGSLILASEIKALHATGTVAEPDPVTWAGYLRHGRYEQGTRTFWRGIESLPAGHSLTWSPEGSGVRRWYDLAGRVGAEFDGRAVEAVEEKYLALLLDSVTLRFRSDVPVGINLSGGLDSSTLLAAVRGVQGEGSDVAAFTFATGDPAYDELPWVEEMLARTRHPSVTCVLRPRDVPGLAESVAVAEEEPFGGFPTLAYARLFERARERGVTVLLDGQGMDEQWGGYDYYRSALTGEPVGIVQGTVSSPVRPDCLVPEFAALAEPVDDPQPFSDTLRNAQYRDLTLTKIPRALRFNDRVSMRAGRELREPFLDHRLVELALRQPAERKIRGDAGKYLLRRIVTERLPSRVMEAPKRAVQTPQREWLRGPLRAWVTEQVELALEQHEGTWLRSDRVRPAVAAFLAGEGDNSFFVWQWLSLALHTTQRAAVEDEVPRRGGCESDRVG